MHRFYISFLVSKSPPALYNMHPRHSYLWWFMYSFIFFYSISSPDLVLDRHNKRKKKTTGFSHDTLTTPILPQKHQNSFLRITATLSSHCCIRVHMIDYSVSSPTWAYFDLVHYKWGPCAGHNSFFTFGYFATWWCRGHTVRLVYTIALARVRSTDLQRSS